jgi:hypothetical protein
VSAFQKIGLLVYFEKASLYLEKILKDGRSKKNSREYNKHLNILPRKENRQEKLTCVAMKLS